MAAPWLGQPGSDEGIAKDVPSMIQDAHVAHFCGLMDGGMV